MLSHFDYISNSKPIYTQILPNNQQNIPLRKNLSDNLNILHNIFLNCNDVIFHEFMLDSFKCPAVLIFISDLVEIKLINEEIMPSLLNISQKSAADLADKSVMESIKKYFIRFADLEGISTIGDVIDAVLNGTTVLLVNDEINGLKLKTTNFKDRNISEPTIEKLIRGPKEGFTENIFTNISLIRRKIKSSELKFEEFILGRETQTKVEITYLKGIADQYVIDEVKSRLERIDVDSILESGYVEELIEDTPYTVFPLIQHSERPDKIAAGILEGRVAILVDGTPFVLMAPAAMNQFFQSCDDYYERFTAAAAIRIIRYIFAMAALLLPGLYVAAISYHSEMIPTRLAITILRASHQVPFPIFVEALIMDVTFEALREAGIRLPGPANQTVGIVGVLVIGDAAVRAGLVSPITVVIIAVTAVSSFGVPSYDMGYAFRILRFAILLLGALLGLYGIMIGLLITMFHLVSLKSFGTYYLSPVAPLKLRELKDFITRFPWWAMDDRPGFSSTSNKRRQKHFLKPKSLHRKES
ncbi:MAG: spore germination protein [Bacillota bacterium]|nr:spore germination protein [Bacillota bacterium]